MLNLFDLFQNVTLITHKAGKILDSILTTKESYKENLISDIANQDFLSDHCIIKLKIALPRPPTEIITITHRNLDRIDLDKFKVDQAAKLSTIKNSDNLQELII